MKNNKYDFIANMFTGKNELRPAMRFPSQIGNEIYATDAHTMIRFSKELTEVDYTGVENFPKANKVMEDRTLDKSTTLNVEDLMLKIYSCQTAYDNDTETCDKCGGSGGGECPCCGNDGDCKECDATGVIEKETPFARVTLNGSDIKVLDKYFLPKFLYKVIEVALILKQETIEAKYSEKDYGVVFKVGEVEILVMSKHKSSTY